MTPNRWTILLLALALTFAPGCPGGDDDDAGDDDATGDDDDVTGDDDDSTPFDPDDQDGDGSKTTDDPPDCDDDNPLIYPGAWELWDYDDNDCDNDIDEHMPLHRQCMLQGDSYDGMAIELCAPGDVNDDGLADMLIATEQRGVLVFFGSETRCDYNTETLGLDALDDPGSGSGAFGVVMAAGDIDDDERAEIFIAAPLEDSGASGAGVVYMHGVADGMLEGAEATFRGTDEGQNFGIALLAGEDINADGFGDLLIAARLLPETWKVFLYFGSNGGFSGELGPADADAVISGPMSAEEDLELGLDVAEITLAFAPDLNGDNASEVMIGTPYDGVADEGKAYLMMSRASWEGANLASADVRFTPSGSPSEHFGADLGSIGDVVGGETPDLFVTAPGLSGVGQGSGRVHVYAGRGDHSWQGVLSGEDADSTIGANIANDFGLAVIRLGDIELDGNDDLAVLTADHEVDEYGFGAMYLVRGRNTGLPETMALSERNSAYLAEANDYLGPTMEFVGDMDGDGNPDMAIGDYHSGFGDGRVYIVYTPESPLAK